MGIDIYLQGYEAHQQRIAEEKKAFDLAVAKRDKLPGDGNDDAQNEVEVAYDKMYTGKKGYLRSSYNGSGLFRVLEEIFGIDPAGLLFPGDWNEQGEQGVEIDGAEFVKRVRSLQETAILAMSKKKMQLPWIEEYTEITGEKAPDPNLARANGEAFGDKVFGLIAGLNEFDKIEGGPTEDARSMLSKDHAWYLTEGLQNLLDFGMLAKEMNDRGEETFAYISY